MIKKINIFILIFSLASALTSCGAKQDAYDASLEQTPSSSAPPEETESVEAVCETAPDSEEKADPEDFFSYVPYSRDYWQPLQYADGYLYAYLNGTICRYDPDTLQKTVLYQTYARHEINFCVCGDYIYFTDRPYTTTLTGRDTALYRIKCDGTEQRILYEEIPNPTGEYPSINYQVEVYDDIVYLMNHNTSLFFRIHPDDSVTVVSEKDSLYGMIPRYYTPFFPHSFPYFMRNYGFVLAMDDHNALVQILFSDNGSKTYHPIAPRIDSGHYLSYYDYILTENSLFRLDEQGQWYRWDFDDLNHPSAWLKMTYDDSEQCCFWDDPDIYFLSYDRTTDLLQVQSADPDGRLTSVLTDFRLTDECTTFPSHWDKCVFIKDGYLYYDACTDCGYSIMRISLADAPNPEPELVDAYYIEPEPGLAFETICEEETRKVSDNATFNIEFEQILFTGDTEAEKQINDYLQNIYGDIAIRIDEETEELKKDKAEYDFGEDDQSSFDISARVLWITEHYIEMAVDYGIYFYYAAHGSYWTDYYIFDRSTGQRLAITDLVNNPEEEICSIIAAYIDANCGFTEGTPPSSVLDPDRLYLDAEGIGIHYDKYELSDYTSAGGIWFVIPFSAFEMKLPANSSHDIP